jgi:hypothetical protein
MHLSRKDIFTHLAALAIGWMCVHRIIGDDETLSADDNPSVRTKAGERQAAVKNNASASGLLAPWNANTPDQAMVERLKNESVAAVADSVWNEFFKTDDDGKITAVAPWVSEENLDVIERFRELLLADPKGMREWFAALPEDKRTHFASLPGNRSLANAIPDDQFESWASITPTGAWIETERGTRVGRSGDLVALERMLADAEANRGAESSGIPVAIANWPVDRIDMLIGKLDLRSVRVREGLPNLLNRIPLEKRVRFVESLTSFADGLPGFANLRLSLGLSGTGMDLEERAKLMMVIGDDMEGLAPKLVTTDINRLFSGRELSENESLRESIENVRKGEMKADELLGEVTSRLGKLAEGHEELVRERVFQQLAKIAPDAALTLMEGTPAKTLQDKAFSLGLDPAGFESAASILRAREPEVPNDLHSRFSGWGHKSFEGLARYGDAYVSWAMSMPRSLERDLVISAIAIHVEKDDPQRAAQLRAEKTYQKGWKPGMK